MDRHHLRVHREWDIGVVTAARAFEWDERLRDVLLLGLLLFRLILLLLQLLLQIHDRRPVKYSIRNAAMREGTAIEARTMIVVALSDYLATTNNDAAMTIVQRRLGGLLEAKSQIVVRLHVFC